jgi:hypothetical protein
MAKNSVRPRDPKYARENGSLSADNMCLTSAHQSSSSVPSQLQGHSRFQGPCRMAKPSMNSKEPSVNARANLRGLTATALMSLYWVAWLQAYIVVRIRTRSRNRPCRLGSTPGTPETVPISAWSAPRPANQSPQTNGPTVQSTLPPLGSDLHSAVVCIRSVPSMPVRTHCLLGPLLLRRQSHPGRYLPT